MAKLTTRTGLLLSGMLFTAVGCGFPHDRYASDAMFGSFNRPIAPTPPIFLGGDPGTSPGYDGGARLGLPSPDVSARSSPSLERMFIAPTFSGSIGFGSIFRGGSSGGIERVSGGSDVARRATSGGFGAKLIPAPHAAPERSVAAAAPAIQTANASSVKPRVVDTHSMITSGASLEAVSLTPPVKPLSPIDTMKDPRMVVTIEEANIILATCGARALSMDQQPTGEWRYTCVMGAGQEARKYEARHGEQLEAVRAVMYQVKTDSK